MAFGKQETTANIKAANIVRATLRIVGTAPLVQNKFSKKQRDKMMAAMVKTKADKSKQSERIRDFEDDFRQAQHVSQEGWRGFPCPSIRAAMIDACRTVGLVMTRAKMSVFCVPDGFDVDDGTPLVRLIAGPPEKSEMLVRNDNGSADIRIRPMWREWAADVTVEFDADMITAESVVNLLDRAGRQVGIGEGRPYSKNSVGQGWGTFVVTQVGEDEGGAA